MRRALFHRSYSARLVSSKARGRNRFRPLLESLEDRRLLATIVVDTFNDVVANDGQTSLREAIAEVAALPGDDTIELPAGTYPLSLGQLTINDASGSVTIEATGGAATIDAQFASRVLEVVAGSTVNLEGLTISGGFATDGAGILNAGHLTIEDSTVRFNFAFGLQGGGIYNKLGTLTIDNTVFETNFALLGGAISSNSVLTTTGSSFLDNVAFSNGGGIFNTGTASVADSRFERNSGSGIHNTAGGALTVEDSVFAFNQAGRGGGIHNNNGTVTVVGSEFSSNRADLLGGGIYSDRVLNVEDTTLVGNRVGGTYMLNPGQGGGIYVAGSATIENASLSANVVQGGQGGGIYVSSFSTLVMTGSTLSGNQVLFGDGGGIANRGTLSLADSALTGNYAGVSAGGLLNQGSASLTDSSLSGNQSNSNGGGILNFGPLTVTDSTLSGNSAQFGGGIHNLAGTATISGSTIESNSASTGGGISNAATIVITDSTLADNTASFRGGGISNGGTATISGSTISGNSAGSDAGGGIYTAGNASTGIDASTISNNSAGSFGGGVATEGGTSVVTIANSAISGNSAGFGGGGIYNNASSVTVQGSTIDGNAAFFAGGIYNVSFGGGTASLSIVASTVSSNAATGSVGGGLVNFGQGAVSLSGSTINGNTAVGSGGGLYNESFSGTVAYLSISNSTISGNSADGNGGGIFNNSSFGGTAALTVTAATISGNSAGVEGGGIYNFGTATVGNTIIAGNTAPTAPDVSGAFTSNGYNLIGIGDGSTGFGATGDQVGTAAAPIDPLLGPLADNGGPTETMALLPGSPALNTGDPTLAGTTDQRGIARPQGPGVDIGAFELEYQTVDVEVKPGSDGGPINLNNANGLVPVVIYGSADFDVSSVDLFDLSLVKLGDPTLSGQASAVQATLEDKNGDGVLDLVLFFSVGDLVAAGALNADSTSLLLTAFTLDGKGIFGLAAVEVVGMPPA